MHRGSSFPHLVHRRCTARVAKLSWKIPLEPSFSLPTARQLRIIRAESLHTTVYRYSRADLLRILRLTARQLASWEKAGLVAAAENYSFFDLLQIKKVRDLCAKKVRPAVIRQSLQAMQKQVAGMGNPLLEATAFSTGHRVAFRHDGKLLEPIAGQFVLDFSPEQKVISRTPVVPLRPEVEEPDVAALFSRGIA